MKSVLILCNQGPIGSNSTFEAIRLGTGFLELGEEIFCQIILYGDAVLSVRSNLKPKEIGGDSSDESFEMVDLSELQIFLVKEDIESRGMHENEIFDFEKPVKIISQNEIGELIEKFDTVFHI